jgi:hypothetical protein
MYCISEVQFITPKLELLQVKIRVGSFNCNRKGHFILAVEDASIFKFYALTMKPLKKFLRTDFQSTREDQNRAQLWIYFSFLNTINLGEFNFRFIGQLLH